MALMKKEAREWASVRAKGKRHRISVRRVGPANVTFGDGVTVQLGAGSATTIMDARIRLKKKKKK